MNASSAPTSGSSSPVNPGEGEEEEEEEEEDEWVVTVQGEFCFLLLLSVLGLVELSRHIWIMILLKTPSLMLGPPRLIVYLVFLLTLIILQVGQYLSQRWKGNTLRK